MVVSAAEVAVTVKLPAVDPAVKRPVVETVPPVAVQLTAVFEVPVTVAVNCWVAPVCTVAEVGEIVTETTGAACTVTCAVADLVLSAAEVAVTVKLDPLASVPYELKGEIPDGESGVFTIHEFRIVTSSASPLGWETLTQVAGPSGGAVLTGVDQARLTALEAALAGVSGGASNLASITDMSA